MARAPATLQEAAPRHVPVPTTPWGLTELAHPDPPPAEGPHPRGFTKQPAQGSDSTTGWRQERHWDGEASAPSPGIPGPGHSGRETQGTCRSSASNSTPPTVTADDRGRGGTAPTSPDGSPGPCSEQGHHTQGQPPHVSWVHGACPQAVRVACFLALRVEALQPFWDNPGTQQGRPATSCPVRRPGAGPTWQYSVQSPFDGSPTPRRPTPP